MTSILTNTSATAALQTLRSVNANLTKTQTQASSGLRVEKAADNAAYWSISTVMRSDQKAISAVSDALGIGAAKVDTAYEGMSAVIDVLSEFNAKLVASKEPGVDTSKIQDELEQLKQQIVSISNSASFSGQNWLNTFVEDISDSDNNIATVVSAFTRDSSGSVAVNLTKVHLSQTSLFNETGGGILQADPRDVKSIGGMRGSYVDDDGQLRWGTSHGNYALAARTIFTFSGPINFDDPSDEITLDITVDADNPAHNLPGAQSPGKTTAVVIDRSTLDAVDPSWGGVISTYHQYISALDHAMHAAGADASATHVINWKGEIVPDQIAIVTDQYRPNGLNGSYIEISNAANSTNSRGNLADAHAWAGRGSTMTMVFDPFQLAKDGNDPDGVAINFDFSINGGSQKSYSFDRTYVNTLLSKDNGKVENEGEMVTILQSLLNADWPDLIIESTGPSNVTLRTDPNADRLAGAGTSIGFTGINVSIEPIPVINLLDIDVAKFPRAAGAYIDYIETVMQKATSGASALGALQTRIDMQADFASSMQDNLASGIGRLVDADMETVAARSAALQTQQQLAIQSLSIANRAPQTLLELFQ
ncbi:flagellin [Rhizobium leguminosarum]|uniref:flagellin N-terminal helical domain-containing protein n=1 Tax=Rhizobium leguminosarum TaxID=384 RepID=UPI000485D22E|nr:flagellin [Rhizobium leguminosarum]WFT86853.1 flagellin [Rhizobium leguminosarum]